MAEQEDKKTLKEWAAEHPKAFFAIRASLWAIFAAILPFCFIAFRYGLFEKTSSIQISGWGFVGIVILAVFLVTLIKYLIRGLREGFVKQCVVGFISIIIPLLALLFIIRGIAQNIALFEQALGCVIVCEAVGIPLNPFPDWLREKRKQYEKEKDEKKATTFAEKFWDKYFSVMKDKDGD